MEQELKDLVQSYKSITLLESLHLKDDVVTIRCYSNRYGVHPYIALRILNKYPDIRMVWFTGGFVEAVYTRETLKWCGYKVKSLKEN